MIIRKYLFIFGKLNNESEVIVFIDFWAVKSFG